MKITSTAVAGTLESSDVYVKVEPSNPKNLTSEIKFWEIFFISPFDSARKSAKSSSAGIYPWDFELKNLKFDETDITNENKIILKIPEKVLDFFGDFLYLYPMQATSLL